MVGRFFWVKDPYDPPTGLPKSPDISPVLPATIPSLLYRYTLTAARAHDLASIRQATVLLREIKNVCDCHTFHTIWCV